ncbi:MAG: molybdopterin molybdotransferase MoeA [Armatimonadota bacterium]|nr:molybdopterin molybdotransferase MoeA [Armatimonadota bacterium]MDW8144392.1 molybdopterin molybdotransferase MoeA [Armatimonadota bacterium]
MRHYLGGKPLTKIDEAFERLMAEAKPVNRTETVTLTDSVNRVLAENVTAPFNVPPFRRAAMDGYAVKSSDVEKASPENPVSLKLIGSVHAGELPMSTVEEGTCIQIATGAPVPEGADCVVPIEDTERDGEVVRVLKAFSPNANITEEGADVKQGSIVLTEGNLLTPAKVGVLAALGFDKVKVYAKPKIAILPTGDEIAKPGTRLQAGQIYDVNTYTVAALASQNGCEPLPMEIVPDEPSALQQALNEALAVADFVVFSAGSAVGERDLLPKLLSERGIVLFHGLAVRPGRPTLAAIVDGKIVVNLPGFPTSCLMMAMVLLVPVWRKMARLSEWQPKTVTAILDHEVHSPEGLRQFLTVRLKRRDEGFVAESAYKESGTITSLSEADGFIVIPENVVYVPAGEKVTVLVI